MKKIKIGNGTAYLSDCLDAMRSLDDSSIDLTITSPPYDSLRDYNGYTFPFTDIANELYRITKDGGRVVWNVFDQKKDGGFSLTSMKQVLYFCDTCGFKLSEHLIWDKGTFSAPNSTSYHNVFEHVFVLTKGNAKTFNPLMDRPNKHGGKTVGVVSKTQKDGSKPKSDRKVEIAEYGKRFNIWQIPTEKRSNHPAPFPIKLVEDIMLSYSNPSELILDPFGGSFTTALAAEKNDRKWIVCELSEQYFNSGIDRLETNLTPEHNRQ